MVERYGQDSWCALSEVSGAVIYGDVREIEISNNQFVTVVLLPLILHFNNVLPSKVYIKSARVLEDLIWVFELSCTRTTLVIGTWPKHDSHYYLSLILLDHVSN